jgi:hypothetical protein
LVSVSPTISACNLIRFSIPAASFGSLSFGMMHLTFCDAHHGVVFVSIHGGLFTHVLLKRESPSTLVSVGAPLFRPLLISCHEVIIEHGLPIVGLSPIATR